jgi:hypothetical protein
MKKIILTVFAATSLLLYSTPSFALFSVSVGVPVGATFTTPNTYSDGSKDATDGISGYFLGVQLPIALGLGMDSHTTKIKDSLFKVKTTMYNLYYQLPVPVVSLILGLGTGSSNFDCANTGNSDAVLACKDYYEKGTVTQWYTSIGIPLIPLFDIHLSYRSITNKKVTDKESKTDKNDLSSTITGLGLAFNF